MYFNGEWLILTHFASTGHIYADCMRLLRRNVWLQCVLGIIWGSTTSLRICVCTCACRNMPGWYSSSQSTCHTSSEPSIGWMLNSMSAALFQSPSSTSSWWSTAAAGRETEPRAAASAPLPSSSASAQNREISASYDPHMLFTRAYYSRNATNKTCYFFPNSVLFFSKFIFFSFLIVKLNFINQKSCLIN